MSQYHKYLRSWTNERNITSFLGSEKQEFLADWKDTKMKPNRPLIEVKTEPMEIAEPTVSNKVSPKITIAPPKLKPTLKNLLGMETEDFRARQIQREKGKLGGGEPKPKPKPIMEKGGEPKPKPKPIMEKVGGSAIIESKNFVSRLPEDLRKYTASFLLETDVLKDFKTREGLYALYYGLDQLMDAEVGKVKYGIEFSEKQKYMVRLPNQRGKKLVDLSPSEIVNSMPAINSAVKILTNKYPEWDIRIYHSGGLGTKSGIRTLVKWNGKKGQRDQNKLWNDFTTAVIKPLLDDFPRWEKAIDRMKEKVIERKEDKQKLGDTIKTDLSVKEILKVIQQVLKEFKKTLKGYTTWKTKTPNYIIAEMIRIFDEPSTAELFKAFKTRIEKI